ncbi:universal stress protein [Chachezhania sediminis]|uniref:universal stress protein n=1 Tax=Chachezhania sediminis TaxID=2599291 RepID=UPI00131B3162|nr:universal stress protein [Chachezhania sediminis]
MSVRIIVGLDGTETGERALAFARDLASHYEACEITVAYVIEWSPFTFQTAEENEKRHKRREEEISIATTRIVAPAVDALKEAGFNASGVVKHGDVAETLNRIAADNNASQIVVGRTSSGSITKRIFGSASQNLVVMASVPVTVVV